MKDGVGLVLGAVGALAALAGSRRAGSLSVAGSCGLTDMACLDTIERIVRTNDKKSMLIWSRDTLKGLTYGQISEYYSGYGGPRSSLDADQIYKLCAYISSIFAPFRAPFKVYRGIVIPAGSKPRQSKLDLGRHWSLDRKTSYYFANCEHETQAELSDACYEHENGNTHEGMLYEAVVDDPGIVDWPKTLLNASIYTAYIDFDGMAQMLNGSRSWEKEVVFRKGMGPRVVGKQVIRIA